MVSDRIRFYQDMPHPDVAKLFSAATVFCLPSRQEAFGIVILEAGCVDLPVVAPWTGCVPEIITQPALGELDPPNDQEGHWRKRSHLGSNTLDSARDTGRPLKKAVSWIRTFAKYVHMIAPRNPSKGSERKKAQRQQRRLIPPPIARLKIGANMERLGCKSLCR
jgi:Glycosyl transferases group 1